MKKYGYNPIYPTTKFDLWMEKVQDTYNNIMLKISWLILIGAIWFFATALNILIHTLILK